MLIVENERRVGYHTYKVARIFIIVRWCIESLHGGLRSLGEGVMKRKIGTQKCRLLLAAAALLVCLPGCQTSEPEETESTRTEGLVTTGVEKEEEIAEEETALSDLFLAVDESGSLLQYSGDALEGLSYPEYVLWGDRVLLWETNYSESGEGTVKLLLLDLSSGELCAQTEFVCESVGDLCVTEDSLFLCDNVLGQIVALDETLEITGQWEVETNYEGWYLSADGSTLYRMPDTELIARNLETGEETVRMSGTLSLYGSMAANGGVDLSCVYEDTLLSAELWLDLESGEILEPPFYTGYSWVSYRDGLWLGCDYNSSGSRTYLFGTDEDPLVVEISDGALSLTEGGEHLIYESSEDSTLILYNRDGSFAASCTPTGEDLWYASDFCTWSETFQGYFLLAYSGDETEIFFWVPDTSASGEDLNAVLLSEYDEKNAGTAADADLYEWAQEIETAYGVEVRIADQCAEEYEDFSAEQVLDRTLITEGLALLETSLAVYPDGFLDQLQYDTIRTIQINLMGTLTASGSGRGDENYTGFTQEDGETYVMVIDLNQLESGIFFHEFSHIIDNRLSFESIYCEEVLFSEDTWYSLNPDGFEYAYEYEGFDEWTLEGEEAEYFIDAYSMVSPTEDRARVMEFALNGSDWVFDDYPYLKEKLAYYSECIRDSFDTTGWPEVTAWEEALY